MMLPDKSSFRKGLIDDYQGALVRLATLRADGEQYLLFAWVELFPFDMNLPSGWTAGDKLWTVPGHRRWSCGFSAKRFATVEALDWYEAAASGSIDVGSEKGRPIKVHTVQLGPEPVYGRFCTAGDAPFTFLWHGGPRIHRYVPLSENPRSVRQLAASVQARQWLVRHLGFDPYRFDEWLGGLALVAPDPLCSSLAVFPSARAEDGAETLTIYAVPRRTETRGIAALSSLSVHVAERRADGWTSVCTVALGESGYATILNPQPHAEVGYALVCARRGLLRFAEPLSWMEQVGIGMNVANSALRVEVPSGGRRKPSKTIDVLCYVKGADISVGEPVKDVARQRLIRLRERRKARDKRGRAPQKVFGVVGDEAIVPAGEVAKKRKEAEDFVGGLVSGAQRRVLFVDPFFGLRETRLFALRVSRHGVVPRILTGWPALSLNPGASGELDGDRLVADLEQLGRTPAVQVPEVRVMSGKDKPAIHDRYLIVDGQVWHCGPSFNEIGQRLGVVVRLPDPLSVRRLVSKIWCRSTPLFDYWREYHKPRDS